jgi:putative endonuclease
MLDSLYRLADFARDHGRRRSWDPDLASGKRGEDIAHRFLQRAGMTVVARNHRTRSGSGEVDLIAWEGETLVFIEVKSRATEAFGPPDRAIDDEKRRKLIRAGLDYAQRADIPLTKVRFDVVNVVFSTPPALTHYRDVFTIASVVSAN